MTEWQFLIQKDGDRDWLPLESPNAEILEGRYRLLAQAGSPTVAVEVQLRHEYDLDGIPQEVVQRRWQQVDAHGCLDLLPLTYLSSGFWEIRCQWAEGHKNLGKPLQKRIALQVLAQEFELLSDWDNWDREAELFHTPAPHPAPAPSAVPMAESPAVAAVSPNLAAASIELPRIPKDRPEIFLHLSKGICLPPVLHPTATSSAAVANPPQLPAFVPQMHIGWETALDQPAISDLVSLRRIAKSADRQTVQTSFKSLAWQQRFANTLNRLATTNSDTAQSALSAV